MARAEAGCVRVLGLGPGPSEWLTEEARGALERAEHVLGKKK